MKLCTVYMTPLTLVFLIHAIAELHNERRLLFAAKHAAFVLVILKQVF